MRVPGLEPWWAWDTTVPLTIQPQVGSQGCGRLRGGVWETWGEDAFFSVLLLSGARHTGSGGSPRTLYRARCDLN